MIEVPLGDAFAALAAAKRNFEEGGVAFGALGTELVAEDGAKELQGVWLFANAENIDGFLRDPAMGCFGWRRTRR